MVHPDWSSPRVRLGVIRHGHDRVLNVGLGPGRWKNFGSLAAIVQRDFSERSWVEALPKPCQTSADGCPAVAHVSVGIAHWIRNKASLDDFKVMHRIACLTPTRLALLMSP